MSEGSIQSRAAEKRRSVHSNAPALIRDGLRGRLGAAPRPGWCRELSGWCGIAGGLLAGRTLLLAARLGGEPAMTIVPNLLLTGILAISVSLIVFVWATRFVQHTHGGLILMLLSIILLLVGGGFGPPLLGIILGIAALGINARFPWWRAHLPHSAQHVLSAACPWSFGAALIAWLLVMPGSMLLDRFFGLNERALYTFIIAAFSLLLLTIITGFVYDTKFT